MSLAFPGRRGIALDTEQEFGRHEHRLDRGLDAALEVAACAISLVERVQRLDIAARHRTPERAVRQRCENVSRAGRLLSAPGGLAYENRSPARGVSTSGGLVRTADDQLADFRLRRPHVESLQAGAAQSQV